MRRILGHLPRLFFWLLLAGLGYSLYEVFELLGPLERWRVATDADDEQWCFFSQDGRFTFSRAKTYGENGWKPGGPFRKRDAATGALLAEFPDGNYQAFSYWRWVFPLERNWQRYWAGLPEKNRAVLELLDLENGTVSHFPIAPYSGRREIKVSARDDIAAILHYYEKPSEFDPRITEVQKIDVHMHAMPDGERLDRFLAITDCDDNVRYIGAQFSPMGTYFIIRAKKQDEISLRLWDTRQRKLAASLPVKESRFLPSPDDHYLLILDGAGQAKLWDLSELARPVVVASLPCFPRFFTPDSRTLVQVIGEEASFWDCATGKEKGSTSIPEAGVDAAVAFSPDSGLVAICSDKRSDELVTVVDVDTQKVLWSSKIKTHRPRAYFSADGATLVLTKESGNGRAEYDSELRQARTGKLLASFPNPGGFYFDAFPCGNGRRALIYYNPPLVTSAPNWFQKKMKEWFNFDMNHGVWARVIDLQENREVFRLTDAHEVRDCLLSWDGNTLITHHPDSPEGPHVRCYDVPTRHPWATIVGIPAGLAILFWLLEKWWKRRRTKQGNK